MKPAPRVLDAILSQPWAIRPEWLTTIHEIASREGDVEAVRAKLGAPMAKSERVEVRDGVAIIPITGPIFPRANLITEFSGGTSVQVLALDLQKAVDAPDVRAILLDVDSPGGVAFGIAEAADMIRAVHAQKPVTAYVGGMGCSAAYWLAAAAGEVVAHESALVGSIGVAMGVAVQEEPDQDGYRRIEVVSSNAENKRPDPRTENGLATIRAELDELETIFVDAVGKHRGVGADAVRSQFGRGGVFGGRQAVARRMADRTGTSEETLARLASGDRSGGQVVESGRGDPKGDTMDPKTTDAAAAAAKAQADAVAAARLDGAKAERERLAKIAELTVPGMETLAEQCKADGSTPEAFAMLQAAAQKKLGAAALEQARVDAAKAPPADPNAGGDKAPADDEAADKQKWQADAQLRAEFGGNEKAWLAYQAGRRAGTFRVLAPGRSAA